MNERFQKLIKTASIIGAGVFSIFLVGRLLDRAGYEGIIENPYNFVPDGELQEVDDLSSLGELEPTRIDAKRPPQRETGILL